MRRASLLGLLVPVVLLLSLSLGKIPSSHESAIKYSSRSTKIQGPSLGEIEFSSINGLDVSQRSDEAWPPCFVYLCVKSGEDGRCGASKVLSQHYAPSTEPPCCLHILKEMLLSVRAVLKELRVEWWVHYGTLLGFIRSKTLGGPPIIPWTADADLAMSRSDWTAILGRSAAVKMLQEGLLPFKDGDMGRICPSSSFLGGSLRPFRRGNVSHFDRRAKKNYKAYHPYVDVYLYRSEERSKTRFRTRSGPCQLISEDVFPLNHTHSFFGEQFPLPRRPEKVLTTIYGTTWVEPRPDLGSPSGHGRGSHICLQGL